jgi:plastocyanin
MRRVLTLAGAGLALALLLWAGAIDSHAGAAPLAATRVIQFPVNGLSYGPSSVLINVGDSVEWDGPFIYHPLASDDALWPAAVGQGTSFTFQFTQPGTFGFYCTKHGSSAGTGMSGKVVVSATPLQHIYAPVILR